MKGKKSIGILTGISAGSGAIAVARSIVIARFFGTGSDIAVFFGASTLLMLMYTVTQAGQLGEILLPAYHRVKAECGEKSAQEAFAVVLNWTIAGLILGGVLLTFLTPFLVSLLLPGFDDAQQGLGARLFYPLIPLIIVQVILSIFHTLANAESQYGRPESIGVVGRVFSLMAILALATPLGVWAMVVSLWAGFLVQIVGYAWLARKMAYRHRFVWRSDGFDHWALFRQLGHSFAYVGSTQIWGFAFTAALSTLPTSTFAVFKYVQQLYSKTNAVFMRPIGIVFFTNFSEAVVAGTAELKRLGREALDLGLAVSAFAIVAISLSGRPLLNSLWGGDKFNIVEIELAANLLTLMYGLLAFGVLGSFARKAAISLGRVRSQYLATAMVQLASAALAFPLIKAGGEYGAIVSVALNIIGLGLVPVVLVRIELRWTFFYSWMNLFKWFVACLVVIVVGKSLVAAYALNTLPSGGRIEEFIWAVTMAVGASAVLASIAAAMGIKEVRSVGRSLRRKARGQA